MKIFRRSTVLIIGLLTIVACSERNADAPSVPEADLLLRGGAIYTLNPEQPWAQSIASVDGEIVYVGDDQNADKFIGKNTRIYDLKGEMVVPGLHDSHVHLLSSQLRLSGLKFSAGLEKEQALETIRAFAEKYAANEVILGATAGMTVELDRDSLDQIDPERPIIIGVDGGHSLWANSAALAVAGIDENTPDPVGGQIVRDENGRPNGLLIDTARDNLSPLYAKGRPVFTLEDRINAVKTAQQWFNSFGITSIKELHGGQDHLDTYKTLSDKGELTLRVSQHLTMRAKTAEEEQAFYQFVEQSREYATPMYRPDFVKMNMDGIPGTLFLLQNYPGNNNLPMIDPEVLKRRFIELDAMGFSIAVHAHGTAAVRAVLDAAEAARKNNGPEGPPHQVAHGSLVAPADLPRFKALNVIAEHSPHVAYPNATYDWVMSVMPRELLDDTFPARYLIDHGAPFTAGSDWDSNTNTVNPFQSMEALITRQDPYGKRPGERLGTIDGLTVAEVIAAYTTGGAYAARRTDIGSLEVGKRADIAVLNQNLLEVPVSDISETRVLFTFLDGKLVYQAP